MRRNWLIKLRLQKGLSQEQLAKICGVSNRTISNIETGNRQPSGQLAMKIANALDFDMSLFYQQRKTA